MWNKQNIIDGLIWIGIVVSLAALVFPNYKTGTVAELRWKSYVEVEQFSQVRITDSTSRPPGDAYDISTDEDCTSRMVQDPLTKTWKTKTECHTDYSWTMDRWVVAYRSEYSEINRSPVYNMPTLVHVETGYGNQRLGKQYIKYYLSTSFNKTCQISEKRWRNTEVGDTIKILKLGLFTTCKMG